MAERNFTGFLDTDGMAGQYKTEIALNYARQKSFASGWLNIIKPGLEITYIVLGVAGIIILFVIIFIIWKIKRISISKIWINKKVSGGKR